MIDQVTTRSSTRSGRPPSTRTSSKPRKHLGKPARLRRNRIRCRCFYKDQLNPVAELDGAGNVVARFVYGTKSNVPDYVVKGGQTYRIFTDHLGSVRLVVNTATGEVAQRLEYDAFGVVLEDTAPGYQPFGFAGGIYEAATGLVRFGRRDYDAEVGRWLSKDPLASIAVRVLYLGDETNAYSYAVNDPIGRFDLDGRQSFASGFLKFLRFLRPGPLLLLEIALRPEGLCTPIILHAAAKSNAPDYPGDDPTKAPPDYEWRGKPGSAPGSEEGNWFNPQTGESLHPDLKHPDPIGPHWDYRDPFGKWWRLFPDGTMTPKS